MLEDLSKAETAESISELDNSSNVDSLPILILGSPVHEDAHASDALASGSVIGHYHIRQRIGSGGMGVVYLAVDELLGRKVAIKFLRSQLAERVPQDSLLTEARAAACLEHDRFVRVYSLDRLPSGQPYMVMEYLEGTTLHRWLATPRPRLSILSVFASICEGMAFAHQRGIVHRDLKPENVFLMTDEKVKILDLGLAGLSEPPRSSSLQRARLPLLAASHAGTPLYLAPETWRGSMPTPQVDVWAIGVMLYEALSGGQHPYWIQHDALHANVQRVLFASYRPLTMNHPKIPGALNEIVCKALARDLTKRYSHAGHLHDALRAFIQTAAGLPPRSRTRYSLGEPPQGPRRSWQRLFLLLVTVGTVLLTLGFWAWSQRPPEQMAMIPGGSFTMGSSAVEILAAAQWCEREAEDPRLCPREPAEREQPMRQVTVSTFYLDRTEVTNEQFAQWLNTLLATGLIEIGDLHRLITTKDARKELLADLYPSYEPSNALQYDRSTGTPRFRSLAGFEARPVTQVTWAGAQRYCHAHGKRLPTEAEWEYAARGGGRPGYRFPWGNDLPRCDGVAAARLELDLPAGDRAAARRIHMSCAGRGEGPSTVGTNVQDRSPQGVFDLAGNVSEWVQDPFSDRYAPCGECLNPVVPESQLDTKTHYRVFRGGSWALLLVHTRPASRSRFDGREASSSIGFRCAQDGHDRK